LVLAAAEARPTGDHDSVHVPGMPVKFPKFWI